MWREYANRHRQQWLVISTLFAASLVFAGWASKPICGNNKIEGYEQCDDGNTKSGDGCSSHCKLEPPAPSNQEPDCTLAAASPDELWPPNHKYVPISITGVTDPDGDSLEITILSVTQDEGTQARGSGKTCPDARGIGTSTAYVRSERTGGGDGRVYHITFSADDGNGGECSDTVTVCVPHDQRPGHVCIDSGVIADSTACN